MLSRSASAGRFPKDMLNDTAGTSEEFDSVAPELPDPPSPEESTSGMHDDAATAPVPKVVLPAGHDVHASPLPAFSL